MVAWDASETLALASVLTTACVALGVVFLERSNARSERRDTNRGATYVDAIGAMEGFHLNMQQWAATPTFKTIVDEPSDQELRRLYGRVRVFGSDQFNQAWNNATGTRNAFMGQLQLAAIAHAGETVAQADLVQMRLSLAELADELGRQRAVLERIARSELD